jgi:hypothetical protein
VENPWRELVGIFVVMATLCRFLVEHGFDIEGNRLHIMSFLGGRRRPSIFHPSGWPAAFRLITLPTSARQTGAIAASTGIEVEVGVVTQHGGTLTGIGITFQELAQGHRHEQVRMPDVSIMTATDDRRIGKVRPYCGGEMPAAFFHAAGEAGMIIEVISLACGMILCDGLIDIDLALDGKELRLFPGIGRWACQRRDLRRRQVTCIQKMLGSLNDRPDAADLDRPLRRQIACGDLDRSPPIIDAPSTKPPIPCRSALWRRASRVEKDPKVDPRSILAKAKKWICGLLSRDAKDGTCWIAIPPHESDRRTSQR